MANEKISITAEFVSLMKEAEDPNNRFFVSSGGQQFYDWISRVIPRRKLKEIFEWRLRLSKKFDQKVAESSYEQIVELGAGYSLRGFNLCRRNKGIAYIDTDLRDVILKKREVLEEICRQEKVVCPPNYRLAAIDVLSDDIAGQLKGEFSPGKKTLILAEGLTSYFSEQEFELFLKRIQGLLFCLPESEFYSHEQAVPPRGLVFRLLRSLFISTLTRPKRRPVFNDPKLFEKYLRSFGFMDSRISQEDGFMFYSLYCQAYQS